MKKYLHCGACWAVIGEISESEQNRKFDTFDCGWSCDCGRYNLSSDGIVEKVDSKGDKHFIYIRDDDESGLLRQVQNGFDFDPEKFRPKIN